MQLSPNAPWAWLSSHSALGVEDGSAALAPFGGILLEGVDDLASVAELTDKALLSAQTTTVHMRAGKLDYLREKGSKLSINDLLQICQ